MLAKRSRGRPTGTLRRVHWRSLFALMQAAGYDERQLAEALGYTVKTVGDWRRGIRVPKRADIERIAAILAPDRIAAAIAELDDDAPRTGRRKKFTKCVKNSQKKV